MEEIRRFMLFREERYPEERGAVEGEAFMIPLAAKGDAPSPAKNDAQNAIVFLYRQISREGSGRLRRIDRASSRPIDRSCSRATKSERSCTVRARADLDVLAADDAHGLARDVGPAQIIAGTGGYVVGTLGNEVSARRDNVSAWGNEVSVWGNNVPARGNKGTDRGNDIGKGGDKLTGVRIEVYTVDHLVAGGALVLLGLLGIPLAIGRGAIGQGASSTDGARARCDRRSGPRTPACAR